MLLICGGVGSCSVNYPPLPKQTSHSSTVLSCPKSPLTRAYLRIRPSVQVDAIGAADADGPGALVVHLPVRLVPPCIVQAGDDHAHGHHRDPRRFTGESRRDSGCHW